MTTATNCAPLQAELVSALREMISLAEHLIVYPDDTLDEDHSIQMDAARDLIAKAEGRS